MSLKKNLRVLIVAFGMMSCITSIALATTSEVQTKIEKIWAEKMRLVVNDPAIIAAINQQNEAYKNLNEKDIRRLDLQWRAEKKSGNGPLISKVMNNSVSKKMKELKSQMGGVVTEIFIMDGKGLNVGQSDLTTDYMQGDEAKWKRTYLMGNEAIFIDEEEFDESAQVVEVQASFTISDPTTIMPIGAVTIGFNVDKLDVKSKK